MIIIIIYKASSGLSFVVEMLCAISKSGSHFLAVLAHKISQRSGDKRETVFLFQHVSLFLQRFNSILLHDSFVHEDCLE